MITMGQGGGGGDCYPMNRILKMIFGGYKIWTLVRNNSLALELTET